MLECVVNVSEGRDLALLDRFGSAAGEALLDVHHDPDHHRSVFTLAGPAAIVEPGVRALAAAVVERVNLATHKGVHPRIGALDVVPWVNLQGWPVEDGPLGPAVEARDRFASWAGRELGLPCFLYGPIPSGPGAGPLWRTLPEIRRGAWTTLRPDTGPDRPHPGAGAVACGARPVLVAYNLWLDGADLATARRIAAEVRGPDVRALGLQFGAHTQVSCNLVAPGRLGPDAVYDAVAGRAPVARAELVGLAPASVLARISPARWAELDLDQERTIEARLRKAGQARS